MKTSSVVSAILVIGVLCGITFATVLLYDASMVMDVPQDSPDTTTETQIGQKDSTEMSSSQPSEDSVKEGDVEYGSINTSDVQGREELDDGDGWFVDATAEKNLVLRDDRPPDELGGGLVEGGFGLGVYVTDINKNGWEDLLVISGFEPKLFKNKEGRFERADLLPRIDVNVTSALFFDYDNNGYEDLYLLSDDSSVFLKNSGGKFMEKGVGLERSYESVRGASAADYTGNGCLDVFVIQADDWTEKRPAGYDDFVTIEEDNGNPNRLFAGDCQEFKETTKKAGIQGETWSLATSFIDLTNNGFSDIHVANDFNNDVIYLNNGNGTFERNILPDFTDRNGMSSEVTDVTGNGYLDIFVSNIHYGEISIPESYYAGRVRGNNLLINIGKGKFVDKAEEYGVKKGGWGWASVVEDFDNNQYLDIYQTTGRADFFWKNNGRYRRINSSASGIGSLSTKTVAAFDHNRNGKIDLVEAVDPFDTRLDSQNLRFNQNKFDSGNFLQIELNGSGIESTLVGTKVTLEDEDYSRTQLYSSNVDYLSQSSRILHYGLGHIESVEELRVEWSHGQIDVHKNIDTNQRLSISPLDY